MTDEGARVVLLARLRTKNAALREALIPLLAGAMQEYVLSLPENLRTKYGQLMRRLIRDAAVAREPSPAAAERATGSAGEGGSTT